MSIIKCRKKIGKYELGRTLGTGTFSKVKHGIDTETDGDFAIMIIDKAQLAKEHMEEQLKREIAVMKLLLHEHIVQLREVLQTQKHIYLILEIITSTSTTRSLRSARGRGYAR